MEIVESKTFNTLQVGESARWERTLQQRDLVAWHKTFGDTFLAPGQLPQEAMTGILSSYFTALSSSRLPGAGSRILRLSMQTSREYLLDHPLTLTLTVKEKNSTTRSVILDARATLADGSPLAQGELEVIPSEQSIQTPLEEHRLEWLLEKAKSLPPVRTGVVYPMSKDALIGAVESAQAGLIQPVLYGPKIALIELARQNAINITDYEIVDSHNEADSAQQAASAAGSGRLGALMKGSLHTDVLLHAVMAAESGLCAGKLLSHVALISSPAYGRCFALSDVALNIAPTLEQKRLIAQNAINFLKALGVAEPKVAVIAAVEEVNPRMQATLDGAVLAKMAERGQITGGLVEGPLDLDAAVDVDAAQIKGIKSQVAGNADILLVPNIETGNAIYKTLGFIADAQTAGLVIGARVPVILTSRADTAAIRRFSAAAAILYSSALAQQLRGD